jgi:iron complex transport system ATP-binding protein
MELTGKQLSVGYTKTPIAALQYMNLSLAQGQITVLLGRNGTGKSTLLKTLMGMIPPVSGNVLLNNQDLHTIHPKARAKMVSGMLTGIAKNGLLTVKELIGTGRYPHEPLFGPRHDASEHIMLAAAQSGIEPLLHKKLNQISDGELQRAMIARMLVQEAPFWLLDEPAAFLDMSGRFQLHQLLKKAAGEWNKGVLISTHDLELVGHQGVICWLVKEDGLAIMPGGNETKSAIADYFCHAHGI